VNFSTEWIDSRDGEAKEVDVAARYYHGTLGSFYRSNGDPGDPPEPGEVEIMKVVLDGKNILSLLSENDLEHLTCVVENTGPDHCDSPEDREADDAYDQWKDRDFEEF
jgi:hypothetical protein